jgi:CheY-like chemotaxis protein
LKLEETERLAVMLVEDSLADVYLVREAMREEGLECDLRVAEDGEKAIQIIDRVDQDTETPAPSMALLDINVPKKNGTQVLERLRQSARCGNIPIVMISSSDSPAERQRAFELGATDYFRKPSSLNEFMQLGKLVRRLHEQAGAKLEGLRASGR